MNVKKIKINKPMDVFFRCGKVKMLVHTIRMSYFYYRKTWDFSHGELNFAGHLDRGL
jgi:hypothetical protein